MVVTRVAGVVMVPVCEPLLADEKLAIGLPLVDTVYRSTLPPPVGKVAVTVKVT